MALGELSTHDAVNEAPVQRYDEDIGASNCGVMIVGKLPATRHRTAVDDAEMEVDQHLRILARRFRGWVPCRMDRCRGVRDGSPWSEMEIRSCYHSY